MIRLKLIINISYKANLNPIFEYEKKCSGNPTQEPRWCNFEPVEHASERQCACV